jgi:hypothetical protein
MNSLYGLDTYIAVSVCNLNGGCIRDKWKQKLVRCFADDKENMLICQSTSCSNTENNSFAVSEPISRMGSSNFFIGIRT